MPSPESRNPPDPPAIQRAESPSIPGIDAAGLPSLERFVGTWRGEGRGTYPTITDFAYGEEITLRDIGRPFLLYEQRTWALDDGKPLHAEAGYWRPKPAGRIELLIAQATGMVEVDEGTIDGGRVEVASRAVASAATGPDVSGVTRSFDVDGDILRYELRMAAVGHPLLLHLEATLHRVAARP
jgi:hypothetical protein